MYDSKLTSVLFSVLSRIQRTIKKRPAYESASVLEFSISFKIDQLTIQRKIQKDRHKIQHLVQIHAHVSRFTVQDSDLSVHDPVYDSKLARRRFRSRFTISDRIQNWSDHDSGHNSRFRTRFKIGQDTIQATV